MRLKLTTLMASLIMTNIASAATLVDLHHQPASYLQQAKLLQATKTNIEKTRIDIDSNQTSHTRIQQTYAGVPVWDATGVIHTPKNATAKNNPSTMNGVIYEGLEQDLSATPNNALTDTQKSIALQKAKSAYAKQNKQSKSNYTKESVKTIVFVDDKQKAHYAYLTQFYLDNTKTGAHRPTFIIDATTLQIYRQWDQVLTESDLITAGGIGGNEKTGERIYDGAPKDLPGELIAWDKSESTCLFSTDDIVVEDVAYGSIPVPSNCIHMPNHNNVAWLSLDEDGKRWADDQANGGYSPTLDAFYNATIVKKLYQDWYHVPVLTNRDGTPMKLIMRVHYGRNYDNAFWDGEQMTFGDGGELFYPLTSLDVTAHEISHGFTEQHSGIDAISPAMGALHEAFSDMAAAAAEFYVTGKNSWSIGSEVMKGDGAFRYMDDPKKDGKSIDNVADFSYDMDEPHLVAGVYSKAFYLIATSKGWDTHKAFDVMVKANMNYWTSSMHLFKEAACGVVNATKDLAVKDPSYNVNDVIAAFKQVGIQASDC